MVEFGRFEGRVNRVIRGGSWNNKAQNVRSAYRNRNEPSNRNNNLGFRCAGAQQRMDVRHWPRPVMVPLD